MWVYLWNLRPCGGANFQDHFVPNRDKLATCISQLRPIWKETCCVSSACNRARLMPWKSKACRGTAYQQHQAPTVHLAHGRVSFLFFMETRSDEPLLPASELKNNLHPRYPSIVTVLTTWPIHEVLQCYQVQTVWMSPEPVLPRPVLLCIGYSLLPLRSSDQSGLEAADWVSGAGIRSVCSDHHVIRKINQHSWLDLAGRIPRVKRTGKKKKSQSTWKQPLFISLPKAWITETTQRDESTGCKLHLNLL